MAETIEIYEKRHRNFGVLLSFIIHLLLLLILFTNWFERPPVEEKIAGILVSFGDVDSGNNEDTQTQNELLEDSQTDGEEVNEDIEPSNVPESDTENEISKESQVKQEEEVKIVSEISEVVIAEKENQNESKSKAESEAEKRKREEEERALAEEKRKAEEEAKKKAEFEAKKKKFGNLFGKGSGSGSNSGNEGNPEGDPNSKVLDELSLGSGNVGGGLTNRGLLFEPEITDNSQKTGKVVMDVCVNQSGEVIEARWTQKGSTTTDSQLKSIAQKAAYKYKFTKSEVDRQCGTITIKFEVQ